MTTDRNARLGQTTAGPVPGAVWMMWALLFGSYIAAFTGVLSASAHSFAWLFSAGRWAALVAAVPLVWMSRARRVEGGAVGPDPLQRLAAAFVGLCLVSALLSPFSALAGAKWLAVALSALVMLGVCPGRLTAADWRAGLKVFYVAVMVQTLANAYYAWTSEFFVVRQVGQFRGMAGTNPNTIAFTSVLAFCFPVTGLVNARGRPWPLIYNAALCLACLSVVIKTGSRTSLGSIGLVSAATLAWGLRGRWGALSGPAILLGLVSVLYLMLPNFFVQDTWRLFTRGRHGDVLATRRGQWEAAFEAGTERPLFGWGFGVSQISGGGSDQLYTSYGSVRDGAGLFGIFESIGVVGFLVFALLTAGAFGRGLAGPRPSRRNGRGSVSIWPWLPLLTASIGFGIGENLIIGPGNPASLAYWFAIGGLVGTNRVLACPAAGPIGRPMFGRACP